jgi:hypothetical protein
MDWVEALATYLVEQGLFTAVGTDIFVGELDDPGDGALVCALAEYNGQIRNVLGWQNLPVESPNVQISVRGGGPNSTVTGADVRKKLKDVRTALHTMGAQTVHGNAFAGILPNGTIHFLGRDPSGRFMLTASSEVWLQPGVD